MPKVYLTDAQRQEAAVKAQQERISTIVRRAMGFTTGRELAEEIHAEPAALCRRLRGQTNWDVPTLFLVADALQLDDKTRAALLGSKIKCRFEDGYKERAV